MSFVVIGQDTVWALGATREECIAEARHAGLQLAYWEWGGLEKYGTTGPRHPLEVVKVAECSPEFAALVERQGGAGLRWREDAAGVIQVQE